MALFGATDCAPCRETSPRCTLHSPRFPPPPRKHDRGSPETSGEDKKPQTHRKWLKKTSPDTKPVIQTQPQTGDPILFHQSAHKLFDYFLPPLPAGLIPSWRWLRVFVAPYLHTRSTSRAAQTGAPAATCPYWDALQHVMKGSLQENFQRIPASQRPASCSRNKGGFS